MSEGLLNHFNGTYCKVKLTISSEQVDHETIEDRAKLPDASGWIARQSGVCPIINGQGDDPQLGNIISAELTHGNTSLQIRRIAGQWLITTLTEGHGETHLADSVFHLTTTGKAAQYKRYWHLPNDGAVEVAAWRFIEFQEVAQ